ncbi:MAG TPA: glycoside hydrolase domain-containing protein, partial [Bacteroidota bacterium]|nr:glycoside hydrolase domain-containing protein [Bacteroidota bacterium]
SVEISTKGGGAMLRARSGPRILRMGERLNFDFDLLVTPFRTMNRTVQFDDRYYHTYMDQSAGYLPEAISRGANIINVHHKSDVNPFINYPYLDANVPYLRAFVDSAHAKNVRVKVYYTTRELTVNIPEFWALRSLDGEVIFPGPGNESRTVIHPDGPPAWMKENLKESYIPAWVCDFREGRYKGVRDMAVITTPDSRWNNFYLEGLNWMAGNLHIDGIYVDDCALDRATVQRARKILDDRRPAARIDLHSWNHFCDVAGWASCLNIYMDFLPYVDLVWIGEARDYDLPPDNWLIEVSGIPFGIPGQMLAGGGNRWRGMVYGMTNRLGWIGPSPDPLWKYWDAVRIQDMEMIGYWDERTPVRCSSDSVFVTVYKGANRTLLALGNWGRTDQKVTLDLDIRSLGLSREPLEFRIPAIENYQPGSVKGSLRGLTVPGAQGRIIEFDNN